MIYTPDDVFIDHETFNELDLKKVGSYAYAEHKSAEILLTGFAFGDEEVEVHDSTESSNLPADLRKLLAFLHRNPGKKGNPKLIGTNYLMFDRLILEACWGFRIDPRDILDTRVLAYRLSLPGSLDEQCLALSIAEESAKDKRGKQLINRFCKPTPKNYKVRRYNKETHPQEWAEFIHYAKMDVVSDREIYRALPSWGNSVFEDEVLAVDIAINDRGFYVDTQLANAAIQAVKQHKIELQQEAQDKWGAGLTGAQFLPLLRELAPGHEILNAQKAHLADLVADEELPDEARVLIELRQGASSTASTKYNPLILGLNSDGRRRGCLQYGGASRTLRWSGKGFQPQNLARGFFADYDDDGNYTGDLTDGINMLLKGRAHWAYDVSKLTATTVRSCVIPEPGKKFLQADYSNVEGRGIAWLAGEQSAIDVFNSGVDAYKTLAAAMFKIGYDQVNKAQRQAAKAAMLGLNYGGGVAAFTTFAKTVGLNLEKLAQDMDGTFPEHIWAAARRGYEYARIQEKNKKGFKGKKPERPSYDLPKKVWLTCDSIKRMYREANPNIAAFWSELESAVMSAITQPGKSFWAGATVRENGDKAIRIVRTVKRSSDGSKNPGWWLKVELPSGRILSYPGIGISVEKSVQEDEDNAEEKVTYREKIKYMGQNQTTKKWSKIYTYGGKLAENCISGDMLILQEHIGLVRIDAANPAYRVWDGVEFVSFDKLVYKGKQTVITRYGVTLTPDHKVLTEHGWKTASQSEGLNRAKAGLPDGFKMDWV